MTFVQKNHKFYVDEIDTLLKAQLIFFHEDTIANR